MTEVTPEYLLERIARRVVGHVAGDEVTTDMTRRWLLEEINLVVTEEADGRRWLTDADRAVWVRQRRAELGALIPTE